MSTRESKPAQSSSLFDRRVLFVVGKGGVGKSVVVTSMALQAASEGLRVCIAEMNGAESTAALLGCPPIGYQPSPVAEGVEAISITPDKATEEYLVRALRFRRLYNLVFRNRYIEPLDGKLRSTEISGGPRSAAPLPPAVPAAAPSSFSAAAAS